MSTSELRKPVWMLDVDGVLNVFDPSWGAELTRANVAGIPIRYAPALIDRIRELHASRTVDIRWSTTWCGYRHQLDALNHLFGFDFPFAFGNRPMSKAWGDMKLDAALTVLNEGRRLIWADDHEAAAARRLYPAIAAAERDGRALLVTPVSELGLQPEDLDLIERYLKEFA